MEEGRKKARQEGRERLWSVFEKTKVRANILSLSHTHVALLVQTFCLLMSFIDTLKKIMTICTSLRARGFTEILSRSSKLRQTRGGDRVHVRNTSTSRGACWIIVQLFSKWKERECSMSGIHISLSGRCAGMLYLNSRPLTQTAVGLENKQTNNALCTIVVDVRRHVGVLPLVAKVFHYLVTNSLVGRWDARLHACQHCVNLTGFTPRVHEVLMWRHYTVH